MKLVTDADAGASTPESSKNFTANVEPNLIYPGDSCCELYKDYNYEGESLKLCYTIKDGSPQEFDLRTYDDFDQSVDSWYCGKNIAYDFCDLGVGEDCTGGRGESGAGTVRNGVIGMHNDLTSLRIWPYDASDRGAVTVFENRDCTGATGRFYANSNPNMYADYMTADLEYNHIGDNSIDAV